MDMLSPSYHIPITLRWSLARFSQRLKACKRDLVDQKYHPMKTQKKPLKAKKKKTEIPLEKILERINDLQNITSACLEFGFEAQHLYAALARRDQKLDRVYALVPLEAHEQTPFDPNRKYHLDRDINEIIEMLNKTRNMELACSLLGMSALGITGLLRRNGLKISRSYVARPFTPEEKEKHDARVEAQRKAAASPKKRNTAQKDL
jgi:hypothetical protein